MARAYTLKELSELIDGEAGGNPNLQFTGINGLEYAGSDELTFITGRKMVNMLAESRAGAAIIPLDCEDPGIPHIKVDNPAFAAAFLHNHFLAEPFTARGIHTSAVIGFDCLIDDEISVGPLVCIGDRVRIGSRVTIYPGVVIGSDVTIGEDTVVYPNVTIGERCVIGSRVILHAGAVIGSDGFGFATDRSGTHLKKPQVGNVRIDDDVELGANSCVDRAAFGTTRIRSGAKIDNLVQIAHNVDVGENVIICGQAGVAGSTVLGRNVVLAAKSGVADHLRIGARTRVAAMSGVHNDQQEGAEIGGIPAIKAKSWGRAVAAFGRLPDIYKEMKRLRKEIDRLHHLVPRPAASQEKKD